DFIQFVRYVPILRRQGAEVIVRCSRSLFPLIGNLIGNHRCALEDEQLPEFDLHVSIMDLPYILDTKVETIPAEVPYLCADENLTRHWSHKLQAIEGFRVGILWQGNPRFPADRYRSIRLQEFLPLAVLNGVRLISLQKGHGAEQLLESEVAHANIVDL